MTVNQQVVGSSPTEDAINMSRFAMETKMKKGCKRIELFKILSRSNVLSAMLGSSPDRDTNKSPKSRNG